MALPTWILCHLGFGPRPFSRARTREEWSPGPRLVWAALSRGTPRAVSQWVSGGSGAWGLTFWSEHDETVRGGQGVSSVPSDVSGHQSRPQLRSTAVRNCSLLLDKERWAALRVYFWAVVNTAGSLCLDPRWAPAQIRLEFFLTLMGVHDLQSLLKKELCLPPTLVDSKQFYKSKTFRIRQT